MPVFCLRCCDSNSCSILNWHTSKYKEIHTCITIYHCALDVVSGRCWNANENYINICEITRADVVVHATWCEWILITKFKQHAQQVKVVCGKLICIAISTYTIIHDNHRGNRHTQHTSRYLPLYSAMNIQILPCSAILFILFLFVGVTSNSDVPQKNPRCVK